MAIFDDDEKDKKSTFGANGGDGRFNHEIREHIWRDKEYIAYSDFFAKLYDDNQIYQLIKDLQDEEWWRKIESGKIENRININPTPKKALKSGWPRIQEDADLLFRDLKAARRKSRNYIRDEISNFFADHMEELELLFAIAILQILTRRYSITDNDFIPRNEYRILHEGAKPIIEELSIYFDLVDNYPEFLESAFIMLLAGASHTPPDGGIGENLENNKKPTPPKNDDDPHIRRI